MPIFDSTINIAHYLESECEPLGSQVTDNYARTIGKSKEGSICHPPYLITWIKSEEGTYVKVLDHKPGVSV